MSGVPEIKNLGAGPAELLGVSIAFLVITWIAVSLRVWVRASGARSFGWDDWTIMLCLCSFTIQGAYSIKIALVELSPDKNDNLAGISKLVTDYIAFTGSYVITTIFLKISLAFFFLRIIIDRRQRMVIYVALVAYTLYGLAYFGIAVFACGNPKNFLLGQIQGTCISLKNVTIPASYAQTALNGLTDWIYAILPLMTLWKLKMPKVTKLWACGLVALGAVGSVASLVRLRFVSGLNPGPDFFRSSGHLALWSVIEPGLGMAAVSFATLRPIFKRCLESARNTTLTPTARSGTKMRVGANPLGTQDIPMNGMGARSHIQGGARPSISDDGSEVELAHVTVKTDIEKTYED
ncbi:hypothetical protein MBLNU459_g1941t1 [Dothideomycetes sp. NU459]